MPRRAHAHAPFPSPLTMLRKAQACVPYPFTLARCVQMSLHARALERRSHTGIKDEARVSPGRRHLEAVACN
eukprot:403351-Pelagomonas_calceolata.AAC.7